MTYVTVTEPEIQKITFQRADIWGEVRDANDLILEEKV